MRPRRKDTGPNRLAPILFAALGTVSLGWLIVYPPLVSNQTGMTAILEALIPLVFVWFVAASGFVGWWVSGLNDLITTLIQQNRRLFEDSEAQGRSILRLHTETQRRADLDLVNLILKDMNTQLALMMDRLGLADRAEIETFWALTAAGNPWAFPGAILAFSDQAGPDFRDHLAEALLGDPTATVALQTFLARYETLMTLLSPYEENRILKDVIGESPVERTVYLLTNVVHRLYARLQARHAEKQQGTQAPPTTAAARLTPDDATSPPPPGRGDDESTAAPV